MDTLILVFHNERSLASERDIPERLSHVARAFAARCPKFQKITSDACIGKRLRQFRIG